jgi:peptide/nickel transport system substrate-binding protein
VRRNPGRRALAVGAALMVTALFATACTSSAPSSERGGASTLPAGVTLATGGTATWAEQPLSPPSYIFPINSCCFSPQNIGSFQYLMYRPLYWFGTGGQPSLDTRLSLAAQPVYEHGGSVVVVNLRPNYDWSDGEHVDAADIVFFMNLVQVVKSVDWGAYAPGYFPDNVRNVVATGPYQVTFHLTAAYSPLWFTDNELSQITPLPLAWDVTRKGAKAASGGCSKVAFGKITTSATASDPIVPTSPSAKACLAVYDFLAAPGTGQAANPATYASNPIWGVVDGPWRLKSLDPSTGNAVFVPNPRYGGPDKPILSQFEELGFTDEASEFQQLESGPGIDVGYAAPQDLGLDSDGPLQAGPNAPSLAAGYQLDPLYEYAVDFFPLNELNHTVGPLFKQLYLRRALQYLIDQPAYVKAFDSGYGIPTTGPVPVSPPTYASSVERTNPYPYDPAEARKLLVSHGWAHVGPHETATCARPGSKATDCGTGIHDGERLAFTLLYETGGDEFKQQMEAMVAAWAAAGISVQLKGEQAAEIIGTAGANCFATQDCSWEAADMGGGWVFSPDYLPTGEELFDGQAGCSNVSQLAASNYGGWCDAVNHANILATTHSSSPAALEQYEDYLTSQVPVLFQPLPASSLTEVADHLYGVEPQNVFGNLTPEDWAWQSGFVPSS